MTPAVAASWWQFGSQLDLEHKLLVGRQWLKLRDKKIAQKFQTLNREQLANPPVSLGLDEAAVERLTNLVSAWALKLGNE